MNNQKPIIFGTMGDFEQGTIGVENVFYNPENYNVGIDLAKGNSDVTVATYFRPANEETPIAVYRKRRAKLFIEDETYPYYPRKSNNSI